MEITLKYYVDFWYQILLKKHVHGATDFLFGEKKVRNLDNAYFENQSSINFESN